ncbi:MAG TPA: IS256 family transposase, partial [Chloroflexota bacterium]|nr:IS256 family transposase [Chloroflexota bacterium]
RNGQANGFKGRQFQTRLGALDLSVPQVRDSSEPFWPQSLEKGLRSERALKIALAEMYVQGVSTRKVAAITEQLCGFDVSSAQVSRAAAQLDEQLAAWRSRPLGGQATPYLLLDARYEKVRQAGMVRDAAVLIAVGVGEDGKRRILGVSVAISEHELHWRQFLRRLVERGLSGVQLVVSDDHAGLKAARQAVFGSVPWQRCQFHLQQNAGAYAPRQQMKAQVAADIRAVFNAPDRVTAEALLREKVARYQSSAPKLSAWMEASLPEGLSVFALPEAHRRLLRTTNGLERVNKEIRRRTRVATLFPSEASCLRLISAVLMEISDEWEAGKAYLTFKDEN